MPRCAILAGGLATRLGELSKKTPKSLIEVAGKPFIEHQLALLKREGFLEIVICTGYLSEQIERYVEKGERFGLRISYSHDGNKSLGTGGALRKALPLLGSHFFVIYGDAYLDISFGPVYSRFLESGKKGLMTVFKNSDRWDTSNILFQHGVIEKYDKRNRTPEMKHIDFGLSVLSSSAFIECPRDETFDLSFLYQSMIHQRDMEGFEVFHRFYEIGTQVGLSETEEYLQSHSFKEL